VTALRAQLTVADQQCAKLRHLLQEEFEALRNRDLDAFEGLQPVKAALIADLATSVEEQCRQLASTDADAGVLTRWEGFRAAMLECRDLHRRNEILILRKRDAIESALATLVGGFDSVASVDVYDRLGRTNRPRRRNAYAQA
jgi:flagellar biosynthesis/type III secretory pathway chaperone